MYSGGRMEEMLFTARENLNTEARRHRDNIFKFSEDTENLKNSVALWFYIRMVIMWRAVLHDVKSEPYI